MKTKKPKEKKVKPQKAKTAKVKEPKLESAPWLLRSKLSLLGMLLVVLYFAIAIPLHCVFAGFSMPWFWFGFVAMAAIVASIGISVEYILPFGFCFIRFTFFVWLLDLFYMAVFNRWIVWEYIFGLIAIVLLFSYLIHAFLSSNKSIKKLLPFEFLADVGLSVYLIYRIPNSDLQTIVTTVVAALYGGLLTLTGVAWTIKRQEWIRHSDEKKKYKPLVFVMNYDLLTSEEIKQATEVYVDTPLNRFVFGPLKYVSKKNEPKYCIRPFFVHNTELAYCSVKGIVINDAVISMVVGQVLDKNKLYQLIVRNPFFFEKKIHSISLLLEDMLGNLYSLGLSFSIEKRDENESSIIIKSGIELKDYYISYQEDTP